MMHAYPFLLFWLFIVFLPLPAFTQKIEVERQMSPKQVPQKTIDYLNREYPGRTNVLYYQERNESGRFYEAKFRYGGSRYSVKFNTDGSLYDTEREVRFHTLPQAAKNHIKAGLAQRIKRYRITRIQEQLTDGKLTGYEVELRGNSSGYIGHFEAHFDAEGRFKDIRRIGDHPKDNLFF